jgi:triphosphoribosyl-dephospho-CoA synthase
MTTDPSTVTSAESPLSRGQLATLAILMEITAPKPGNVHRAADFEDVTFFDFAAAAVAIAPAIDSVREGCRLGPIVDDAIAATRRVVSSNTNLGTVLLLAPLALAETSEDPAAGVARVLQSLDADDARLVYQAIRRAQPGGLGRVEEHDVASAPPSDLLVAMRAAAERDLVARQFTNNFEQVLGQVVPWLREGLDRGWGLSATIVRAQLQLLSVHPDSLIARKCGLQVAQEAADRAGRVLESGDPRDENYSLALADFDFWLRSDGHRRNPGTTADLVAAGLFAALRWGIITRPYRWEA